MTNQPLLAMSLLRRDFQSHARTNQPLIAMSPLLLLGQILVLLAIRPLVEMSVFLARIAQTIGFVENHSTNAPR